MSPWKELIQPTNVSLLGLCETLEGGQSFSWNKTSDFSWIGSFSSKLVEIKFLEGKIFWRTSLSFPICEAELINYFWLGPSYDEAVDNLPWRSDSVLAQCVQTLPGLTILNQPLEETLFYFLLSSAKSIPQIKEAGFLVCKNFGTPLGKNLWSFPGWKKLATLEEQDLRNLKLGYRAKYVHQVAKVFEQDPQYLSRVIQSDYEDAKSSLIKLPGVGPKIADCALLFGGKKTQAFPIDTWISKALDSHYNLNSFNHEQKVLFARTHFGKFCGLAQQFLFSGERLGIIKK